MLKRGRPFLYPKYLGLFGWLKSVVRMFDVAAIKRGCYSTIMVMCNDTSVSDWWKCLLASNIFHILYKDGSVRPWSLFCWLCWLISSEGIFARVDSFGVYFQIPFLFEFLSADRATKWSYLSMKRFVHFQMFRAFETFSTHFTLVLFMVIVQFAMFNEIAGLGEKLLANNTNKRLLSDMVPLMCFQMA